MTIAAAATETKATALITECRRCLSLGVDMKAAFIKDVLDQLESVTVNNVTARTDVTPDHRNDGRNADEAAVVDAA